MDKQGTINKIINIYLKDYKNVYSETERTNLIGEMLTLANKAQANQYVLFFEGVSRIIKKEYVEAIEYFEKAIKENPGFAYPWNGLGNVYSAQKKHEKAIECYNKAVELDSMYVFPWNNLGLTYMEQKKYEKAIYYYNKAIKLDPNYAGVFSNLGVLYNEQEQYEKAIECFNKVIEINDKFTPAYRGLGLALKSQEKYKDALKYFEIAKSLYEKEKNSYWFSITESNILNVLKLISAQEEIKKMGKKDLVDPLIEILDEISKKGIEESVNENKKSFSNFLEENKDPSEENGSYLEVLRRWNSFTPILTDSFHTSKGGGYFLKVFGKGIVIDPGFNFIDNFNSKGHSFFEIDYVFITHCHSDHTADLESIITLLYEYNNNIKGIDDKTKEDTIRGEIAKDNNKDINDVSNDDIEKAFKNSPRRKIINFYITQSVFQKYSHFFSLTSKVDYKTHTIEKGNKITLNKNIDIDVIGAKHNDLISDIHSVGFVFNLKDTAVIYTGDSGWDKNIEEQYLELEKSLAGKRKILLAHLGGFVETEKEYFPSQKDYSMFYKNHLGRLGLGKLNQVLKPDICLISEYGEEFKWLRIDIAKIFERVFKKDNILFFAADVGFNYSITENKIFAIDDIDLNKFDVKQKYIEPSTVETFELIRYNSLHYYNKNIKIDEKVIIQVISEVSSRSNI